MGLSEARYLNGRQLRRWQHGRRRVSYATRPIGTLAGDGTPHLLKISPTLQFSQNLDKWALVCHLLLVIEYCSALMVTTMDAHSHDVYYERNCLQCNPQHHVAFTNPRWLQELMF